MNTAAAPLAAHDSKAQSTLIARAAIAGYQLRALPDGSFIVSRWDLFRELASIAAVETFLERAGASA